MIYYIDNINIEIEISVENLKSEIKLRDES